MTAFIHPALRSGGVALVTGSAYGGIGYEVAHILASRYSNTVLLADNNSQALELASTKLASSGVPAERVQTYVTDVSSSKDMFELADLVYEKYGKLDFLILNAGTSVPTKDYKEGGDLDNWMKILNVNMFGVLNGTQAFVQRMVAQDTPGAVVITGSKQGITQPPGNPAYNVSKSAVKSIAESLAHSLLETKLTCHLLVPGYTYTKLTTGGGVPALDKKPAAAWSASQVAEELFSRLGEFYIICPDNDVPWELDAARMAWNADDILLKRPALSRWNPEYKDAFAKFVDERTKGSK